jgi:hypothetical protein
VAREARGRFFGRNRRPEYGGRMESLPRETVLLIFGHSWPFGPAMRWVCAGWRDVTRGAAHRGRGAAAHEELAAGGCAALVAWARDANGRAFTTRRANEMLLAAARRGDGKTFALIMSWRETVPLLVRISSAEAESLAAAATRRQATLIARQARVWCEVAKTEEKAPASLTDLLRLMASGPDRGSVE